VGSLINQAQARPAAYRSYYWKEFETAGDSLKVQMTSMKVRNNGFKAYRHRPYGALHPAMGTTKRETPRFPICSDRPSSFNTTIDCPQRKLRANQGVRL